MRKMRKVTAFVLAAAMMITSLPVSSYALSENETSVVEATEEVSEEGSEEAAVVEETAAAFDSVEEVTGESATVEEQTGIVTSLNGTIKPVFIGQTTAIVKLQGNRKELNGKLTTSSGEIKAIRQYNSKRNPNVDCFVIIEGIDGDQVTVHQYTDTAKSELQDEITVDMNQEELDFSSEALCQTVQESIVNQSDFDWASVTGTEYMDSSIYGTLKKLRINSDIDAEEFSVTEDDMEKLSGVTAVDVQNIDIGENLETIANHCNSLTDLSLYNTSLCNTISDQAKATLTGITIEECGLTDSQLAEFDLSKCVNLESLSLADNFLTTIPDITACTQLEENYNFEMDEDENLDTTIHMEGNSIPKTEFTNSNGHLPDFLQNDTAWLNYMKAHQRNIAAAVSANIVMADTYYAYYDEDGELQTPFYFELPNNTLYDFQFKLGGEEYECERIEDTDEGFCSYKVNDLASVLTEEALTAGPVTKEVSFYSHNLKIYSKNITFRLVEDNNYDSFQEKIVSPYAKSVQISGTLPALTDENSGYEINLLDGDRVVDTIRYHHDYDYDDEEKESIFDLYYKGIFEVETRHEEWDNPIRDYFGTLPGSWRLRRQMHLSSYLTMGKTYDLQVKKFTYTVAYDEDEVPTFTYHYIGEPKTYSDRIFVQDHGVIKKVQAFRENQNIWLTIQGTNLDSDKIDMALTDTAGNAAGRLVSKSGREYTQEEMEENEYPGNTEMKYYFVLTDSEIRDGDIYYQVTTEEGYSCEVPAQNKLSVHSDKYECHLPPLTDFCVDEYPNKISARIAGLIPDGATIHAKLTGVDSFEYDEDDEPYVSEPYAEADGVIENDRVVFAFRTAGGQPYTLPAEGCGILYTIDDKNYTADSITTCINENQCVFEQEEKVFQRGVVTAVPVTAYYFGSLNGEITATSYLQQLKGDLQSGTEVTLLTERVKYQSVDAVKISGEIPLESLPDGRYRVWLTLRDENGTNRFVAGSIILCSSDYYEVESKSGQFVNGSYQVNFVLDKEVKEEDKDAFDAVAYRVGYNDDADCTEVYADRIVCTGNMVTAVFPSSINEKTYGCNVYLNIDNAHGNIYDHLDSYLNITEQKAGFSKKTDKVTGFDIVYGTYGYNLQDSLVLDVKRKCETSVYKTFTMEEPGKLSAEILSQLNENQLYDFVLRDESGIIMDRASGFAREEEQETTAEAELISITASTTQEIGEVGSTIDIDQITVSANYADGTEKTIPVDQCTLSGRTITQKGTNRFTVTYQGKTDVFTISGYASYVPGETKPSYDINGKNINAFYTDKESRSSEIVLAPVTDSMISSVSLDAALSENFETEFDIRSQELKLVLKEGKVQKAEDLNSIVKAGKITLTVAGYSEPLTAYVTIPLSYVKPVVVLSKTSIVLRNNGQAITGSVSAFTSENNRLWEIDDLSAVTLKTTKLASDLTLQVKNRNAVLLTVNTAKTFRGAKKISMGLKAGNWAEEILVSTRLQVTTKVVKPFLTKATITADKGIKGSCAETVYNAGSETTSSNEISITPKKTYTNAPSISYNQLDDTTYVFTAAPDTNTKKGTYTYTIKSSSTDRGVRLYVKITETDFTKKIPTAGVRVWKKSVNKISDGEAGAAGYTITAKTKGTYVSAVEKAPDDKMKEISDKFTVKPVFDGNRITDLKIYASDTADTTLKSGKTYKLKLRITCSSAYDDSEIVVDKTNAKLDKKRIVTVNVKVK